MSGRTKAALGVGAVAVTAVPAVLVGVGFDAAGVIHVAGSFAAMIQVHVTVTMSFDNYCVTFSIL